MSTWFDDRLSGDLLSGGDWFDEDFGDFTPDDFVVPKDLPPDMLQTQPSGDTNPDSFGEQFGTSTHRAGLAGGGGFGPGYVVKWAVGPGEGFGPGRYYGGYTGEGDTIHWGGFEGTETTASSTGSTRLGVTSEQSAIVAPGGSLGVQTVDSSTGSTELGVTSEQSAVVAPDGSLPGGSIEMQDLYPGRAGASTETDSLLTGLIDHRRIIGSEPDSSLGTDAGGTGTNTATDVTQLASLGTDNPSGSGVSVAQSDIYSAWADPAVMEQWEWMPFDDPYQGVLGAGVDDPAVVRARAQAKAQVEAEMTDQEYANTRSQEEIARIKAGLDDRFTFDQYRQARGYTAEQLEASMAQDDPVSVQGGGPEVPEEKMSMVDEDGGISPSLLDDLPPVPEVGNMGPPGATIQRGTFNAGELEYDLMNIDPGDAGLVAPPGSTFDGLDWKSLDEGTQAALTDMMSDPANYSVGARGAGLGMGGLLDFFKRRMIDATVGTFLQPIFGAIDDATGNPWTSRTIQGGLASLGWLLGGDPFGMIAAPIGWGIAEYMRQRQRLIDNNDPEVIQGRKFGYVREGDTWYPAFMTKRERDEGWLGSNKTQMRLEYGTDLRWKQQKGTGKWVPYFEDGQYRLKDFHVWDSFIDTDNEAGKDYMMTTDPLRDFYLLNDEDTDKMLKGFSGGDVLQEGKTDYTAEEQAAFKATQQGSYDAFKPYKDEGWDAYWAAHPDVHGPAGHEATGAGAIATSNLGPSRSEYVVFSGYMNQLQDVRKSLDFMQDYRYSDAGQMQTSNLGENEFAGSRQLHQLFASDGLSLDRMFESGDAMGNDPQQNGLKSFQDLPEMKYLADEYFKAVGDLYGAQKRAGTSMKFNDLYSANPDVLTSGTYDPKTNRYTGPPEMQAAWDVATSMQGRGWAFYQDNAWEFGKLDTADQLKDALRLIEESGDSTHAGTEHYRNTAQRSYLAQKAYARYLSSKINQLGGTDYLRNFSENPQGPREGHTVPTDYATADGAGQNPFDSDDYDFTAAQYGYDPLYSKLDDGGNELFSYGTDLVHRAGYDAEFEAANATGPGANEYALRLVEQAGFFDGTPDPDFVAGRYKDLDTFNEWMDHDTEEAPAMFWDDSVPGYVFAGEQGDNTYWDENTRTYRLIENMVDMQDVADGDGHTTGFTEDSEWGVDMAGGLGGIAVDADGTLVLTPEQQAAIDAHNRETQIEAAARAAKAPYGYHKDGTPRKHPKRVVPPVVVPEVVPVVVPEVVTEPKQTVPDEVPGATAPHEVVTLEHHEALHLAPDSTAPAHIKMI